MTDPRPFRILSLDGGGIKGAFSASVVAELEEKTGHACSDHFDLITGTSTGGIIAIGLALGVPAVDIREFYRSEGPKIFPSVGAATGMFSKAKQLFRPKHTKKELTAALDQVFGDKKLGDCKCRIVIPAYDAVMGRIYVFKTAHHERFVHDIDIRAADIALATAAAPTYFSATELAGHKNAEYVDGGVWANTPTMVGLTEAIHFLGQAPEDVDILSIGTTTEPFKISEAKRKGGAVTWNVGIVELLMRAQAESAVAQAKLITRDGLHRINSTVPAGEYSLDDPDKIKDLIAQGRGEAVKKANWEAVKTRFLNGHHAEPFTPVRTVD